MNCTENDEVYSKPMPWIGLYITAASIACLLAMLADFISGLCHRKFWFPCKYFSLNATTLILLAIATKLPVDLNTPMPRRNDQLTKFSGNVLLCTAMGNMMPSLGSMEDSEVILNVIPLGILVITIIVNVCIQLGTGLINIILLPEYIIILSSMLIMLLILACSALTVPTTKQLLKQKYQQATGAVDERTAPPTIPELKNDMRKYWIMAHSCNPQYVLCRSATSTTAGALCFLSFLVYLSAYSRTSDSVFCDNECAYKWSTAYVFFFQDLTILVGILAPTWRWAKLCKTLQILTWNNFKVEEYWKQTLLGWKKRRLPLDIGNWYCRKIVNGSRNIILDIFLVMQTAVVFLCKSVRFASILIVKTLHKLLFCFRRPCNMICCCPCYFTLKILGCTIKFFRRFFLEEKESSAGEEINLESFVLYLEGEEGLVQMIMKHGSVDIEKWIRRGRKKRLTHLTNLLKKARVSQGFEGVGEYDSDQVPSLVSQEPPNCWALPLVTLTSIAIAVTRNDQELMKSLQLGVNKGLKYVRVIENKLDTKGLVHIRNVADIIWDEVDLYRRWVDVDLRALSNQEQDTKKIIEHLEQVGKDCITKFGKSAMTVVHSTEWPAEVLAGNSMYRICRTILEEYDSAFGSADNLLEWLHVTIADILGACLTNLLRAISTECLGSAIEAKEDSIREAAFLLGEAENILEAIGHQAIQDLGIYQCAGIDDWRLKLLRNPPCPQSATSSELQLAVV